MWLRGSSPGSSSVRYFEHRPGNSGNYPFSIQNDGSVGDTWLVTQSTTQNDFAALPDASVWTGDWVMITMIVDRPSLSIDGYINSVFEIGEPYVTSAESRARTGVSCIGKTDAETAYYGGDMDQVSIWNRILTVGELEVLYNGGNGRAYETW
jgi:hypothetical protein